MGKITILVLLFCLLFPVLIFAGVDEGRFVIFSKDDMEQIYKDLNVRQEAWPDSFWTPSLDQIKKVDILTYLSESGLLKDLLDINNYAFQYYGYILKGKKLIGVQGLCTDLIKFDWKNQMIHVMGGGNCYFHVTYDLSTNKFSDFYINSHCCPKQIKSG